MVATGSKEEGLVDVSHCFKGGQGRNRTTDTRIFSSFIGLQLFDLETNYRDARCVICLTLHNRAVLIPAKLPHASCAVFGAVE